MGKNDYKISSIFTADNTKFIGALEQNRKQFAKFNDDQKATQKKLQTLWNTTHKASRGFDTMRSSVKASTIAMGNLMATGITRGISAITNYGKSAIMAASDAQEMQAKFNIVFGDMSKDAEKWSKEFVGKIGGSILDVKKQMGNSQDLLVGFGASKEAAFELSKQIQSLGSDLSAFNNMSSDEAVDRLRKTLLGEHENGKAMGIIINENTLKQELSARGDKRKLQSLTELEKIELRYAVAVKQSTNAIGAAERESDGFARQLETFKGNMENLAVSIGSKLLPPLTQFVTYVNSNFDVIVEKISSGINQARETFQSWLPAIVGVTVSIGVFKALMLGASFVSGIITFVGVIKKLREMQLLSAAAQALLNTTLLANPITWVVAGIAGAIAIFTNWESVINSVANACKNLWNGLMNIVGLDFLKFDMDKGKDTKKYATGTNYHSGGMALVGEHGPELLNLNKGSSVTPADRTSQILNSNNRSQTINVTVNGYNRSNDEIVGDMVRQLKIAMANI